MSTTAVTTWSGTDLSQLGPIYPFVGTEFVLFCIGLGVWILFHLVQAGIESNEMYRDAEAAKSPERLQRVFDEEGRTH